MDEQKFWSLAEICVLIQEALEPFWKEEDFADNNDIFIRMAESVFAALTKEDLLDLSQVSGVKITKFIAEEIKVYIVNCKDCDMQPYLAELTLDIFWAIEALDLFTRLHFG